MFAGRIFLSWDPPPPEFGAIWILALYSDNLLLGRLNYSFGVRRSLILKCVLVGAQKIHIVVYSAIRSFHIQLWLWTIWMAVPWSPTHALPWESTNDKCRTSNWVALLVYDLGTWVCIGCAIIISLIRYHIPRLLGLRWRLAPTPEFSFPDLE